MIPIWQANCDTGNIVKTVRIEKVTRRDRHLEVILRPKYNINR
jgi:hypothetical protein